MIVSGGWCFSGTGFPGLACMRAIQQSVVVVIVEISDFLLIFKCWLKRRCKGWCLSAWLLLWCFQRRVSSAVRGVRDCTSCPVRERVNHKRFLRSMTCVQTDSRSQNTNNHPYLPRLLCLRITRDVWV